MIAEKIKMQHMLIRYLCVFGSLLSLRVMAHDTFLLPVQETYPLNSDVEIRMSSGLSFPEQTWGVDKSRIEFAGIVLNEDMISSLSYSQSKEYLSIGFTAPKSGVVTAAISTKVRSGTIDSESVDAYLDEIGAMSVVKEAFHELPGKPSLQRSYVKHTKTFLCIASCDGAKVFMTRPMGQKLEFVGTSGSSSIFQLLFDGQPLSNHMVKVKNAAKETIMLMTNENGKFDIDGKVAGKVMLAAVALTLPDEPDGLYHSDQATLVISR